MKHFIVTLLVGFWLLGPHAFADVNAKNGISITTASTINGKTPNSAFNGLTIVSGGGPTLVASDNFNSYTNGADLGLQSGWSTVSGSVGIYKPASDGFTEGGSQSAARSTATFNSDQRSVATCAALSSGSFNFMSVQVRCQPIVDSRYWFQTDGSNWFLVVRIVGAQTVLASGTQAIAQGERIRLDATGAGTATRLTAQYYTGGVWTNVSGAVSIDPGTGLYLDNGTAGIGGDTSGHTALGDDWEGWNL